MNMMLIVSGPEFEVGCYALDEIEFIAPMNGGVMFYFNNMEDRWYNDECVISFREKQ